MVDSVTSLFYLIFYYTFIPIRRYYNNENSPLFEAIKRYSNFFSLFSDFKGYCDFFLLQDLITNDYSQINFFLPFNEFISNPLPKNADEYKVYKN